MVLKSESRNQWETQPRNGNQFARRKQVEVIIPANQPITTTPQGRNPWQKQYNQFNDFQNYFLPTDDIYDSSGTGDNTLPALSHFEYLCEHRIGIAWKIARKPAEDAVKHEFTIRDRKGTEVMDDALYDWLHNPVVDFYNQLLQALYYERVFGIGFLITYFTDSDKEKEKFSKPAPKGKRPFGYQAYPPTVMSPVNMHKTTWLGSNPQKWDLTGGTYNSTRIHHTRVHVIMTRPSAYNWRGLSVFEPMWIPLMSYFQAQVYMLKAFSEMGNVVPAWLIDTQEDQSEIIDLYSDLLDEMKMNGKYVGKRGDEFKFQTTNIGQGLENLMEMWKEDIAAGCNIPIPILFGRISNAGLGSGGYEMAERYYWNEVSRIQHSLSDDVIRIISAAGFKDVDYKKRVDWALSITKTDQQRLMDEGMEIQNELMKEQLISVQMDNTMKALQYQQMQKNPELMMQQPQQPQQGQANQQKQQKQIPNKTETDFIIEKILEDRKNLRELMWGARKVA